MGWSFVRSRSQDVLYGLVLLLAAAGCMDPTPSQPNTSLLNPPKTDRIGEFDPNQPNQTVVDGKPVVTDPVTGPVAILKYEQVRLPMLQIEHALNLFNGLEGRYPQSHDEFMSRIIRENNLKLPELPPGRQYQYDVENHKLLIVQQKEAPDAPGSPESPVP